MWIGFIVVGILLCCWLYKSESVWYYELLEVSKSLVEDLEPKRFVDLVDRKMQLTKHPKKREILQLLIGFGHLCLGRLEDARIIIETSDAVDRSGYILQLYHRLNYMYLLYQRDESGLRTYFENHEEMFVNYRQNKYMKKSGKLSQALYYYHMNLLSDSDIMLKEVEKIGANKLEVLTIKYIRGLIRIDEGDIKKGRKLLYDVYDEGYNVYIGVLARKALENIGNKHNTRSKVV